jgi:hypothetical protein
MPGSFWTLRRGQLGGGRDALAEDPLALDLAADVLRLDLEAPEDLADRPLPFAQDAQQDVLGLDDAATQLAAFVAGEEERSASLLVVPLKHDGELGRTQAHSIRARKGAWRLGTRRTRTIRPFFRPGMKAIHGGKSKNDRIDSPKIPALVRGGAFPQAYVYPRAIRSTRDLLRRRLYFVRKQYNLCSLPNRLVYIGHRPLRARLGHSRRSCQR